MLINYLKIALRSLRKHGLYTLINVVGLTIAVASCLLIGLYIAHHLSFDRFHEKVDRIYRVGEKGRSDEAYAYLTRAKLLPGMLQEIPGVSTGSRTFGAGGWMQREDGQRFREQGLYVDSAFFDVFSFAFVKGDSRSALRTKNEIVLTETLAGKYFGDDDPIGKALVLDGGETYVVGGVVRDFPAHSTVQADFLLSYSVVESAWDALDWNNTLMPTYVVLEPEAEVDAVARQLRELVGRHARAERSDVTFKLMPMSDLHLRTTGSYEGGEGQRTTLTVLGVIAFAIVLIAAINFANLATARSLSRAREIGMRKMLGALRVQLSTQFIGEALLVSYLATAAGAVVAAFLIPGFNYLLQTELNIDFLDPALIVFLIVVGTLIGVLAGLYPAFYLSSFMPIESVKGHLHQDPRGARARSVLVVAQFTVSIVLIIGTLVVWQQIRFMKSQDLNADVDNVLVVPVSPGEFADADAGAARIGTMKQELRRHARTAGVSSTKSIPGAYTQWGYPFYIGETDSRVQSSWTEVDAEYFETFGIDIVEGRSFSDALQTDAGRTAVINETARKAFGWTSAVGQFIRWRPGDDPIEVIGVVEDFHFQSLETAIAPLVHLYPGADSRGYHLIAARITPGPIEPVMDFIHGQLRELDPTRAIEPFFADAQFEALYDDIERRGQLIGAFALLAVVIGCLGLFGLTAYTTVQRTREIGIRKVLGASVSKIVWLLSWSFVRLVAVAFVLAAPLAYIGSQHWLDSFAYRIDIPWGLFLAAGLFALVISMGTIAYQAIRAALADPVKALRYE